GGRLVKGTLARIFRVLSALALLALFVQGQAMARPAGSADPLPIYDPQLLSFGPWSYIDGDPPGFDPARPETVGWKPVQQGSIRWPFSAGVRWFRTEFTIGWQYRTRRLGIALGKVNQADRVYVNGH